MCGVPRGEDRRQHHSWRNLATVMTLVAKNSERRSSVKVEHFSDVVKPSQLQLCV